FERKGRHSQSLTGRVQRVRRMLDPCLSGQMRELAKSPEFASLGDQSALFAMFATALLVWLHRRSGQEIVTLGTSLANRSSRTARATIGCFMQIVPLRFHVAADETFVSLAAKVQSALRQSLRHRRYSVSNSPRRPLYEVLFNFQTTAR